MFKSESSLSYTTEKKQLEPTLAEYEDISEIHRLHIGVNNIFKLKLTTKSDRPVYIQNQSLPINLKKDSQLYLQL